MPFGMLTVGEMVRAIRVAHDWWVLLSPRHGHFAYQDGGSGGAVAEDQVVADAFDGTEHVREIAGDGDLLHGIGKLAVVDPEADGAARVVSGDAVDAEPDELRHVQSLLHALDQILRIGRAAIEVEVGGAHRHPGAVARPVMRGSHAELPRAVGVEEVGAEHALVHHHGATHGQPLAVKGPGAEGARYSAIVHDGDARRGDLLTDLPEEEGRAPIERGAGDRARDVTHEARRHVRIEDDGHLAGLDLPGAEPAQRALGGDLADGLGLIEKRALASDVIPSVALHARALGRYWRHGEAEGGCRVLACEAVAGGIRVRPAPVSEVATL